MTIAAASRPYTATRTYKVSATWLLGSLFILSTLNPWTSFSTNNLDSQPWPIMTSLVFLLACAHRVYLPPHFAAALTFVSFGVVGAILASDIMGGPGTLRAVLSYVSAVACYLAFYNYLERYGFPMKVFVFMGFAWLLVGLIETYSPSLTSFLSPTRTTENRGVTSLAPEPTFFGIYLFVSSWLILAAQKYRPNRETLLLVILNLVAIVALAKASMVLAYLVATITIVAASIFITALLTARIRLKSLIMVTIVVGLGVTVFTLADAILPGTRISQLLARLSSTSILDLILWDASINQRVEAVIMSLHGAFHNNLAPGGIDTFTDTRDELLTYWRGWFWYNTTHDKILSWVGAITYELGFFGIAFIAALLAAARSASLKELLIFVIIALGAIPVAFPLLPMLLALWGWNGRSGAKVGFSPVA